MKLNNKDLMRMIAALSDAAIIEAIQSMPDGELNHMPFDSGAAEWTDSEGKQWEITGKCLVLGDRAILWTSCDGSPDDDHTVIRAPSDPAQAAQEYADEIAAEL